MHGRASGVDELSHFFLAQDGRQRESPFRIGSLGGAPGSLERLGIEEPQRGKIYRDGARCVLPLREQFRLIFANVLRAQAIRRTMEASRKIFHYPDVTSYGRLSVITTLEFFQHHFSQMGHRDLLVTQIYLSGQATIAPSASRAASAARAASFKS